MWVVTTVKNTDSTDSNELARRQLEREGKHFSKVRVQKINCLEIEGNELTYAFEVDVE
jgi:hypothetical protein